MAFQSTHPVWGATANSKQRLQRSQFQSTHPVWGATPSSRSTSRRERFNPRTPCGVRLARALINKALTVSIHAPRVGCDGRNERRAVNLQVSIHAPRVGCDDGKVTRDVIV